MNALGPANFGTILLLYRGCPACKLYCPATAGATELVLCKEVKLLCRVSFIIRDLTLYRLLFPKTVLLLYCKIYAKDKIYVNFYCSNLDN